MAKVICKSHELEDKYNAAKKRSVRFAICTGLCFLAFVALMFMNVLVRGRLIILSFLFIILFGGFAFATVFSLHTMSSLKSGVDGERSAAALISALPDSFTAYRNLEVVYDGKKSEIDLVVAGPTGIFIVETKNHNGTIVGDYSGVKWVQHKVGRGGTPYSNELYSPVKQVGTHVYRLANYLRSNQCRVFVNGSVFFSNPETVVQLMGTPGNIPVFSAQAKGASGLLHFIAKREACVTPKDLQLANELLLRSGI